MGMLVALPPAIARTIPVVMSRRILRIALMMAVRTTPARMPSRICGCSTSALKAVLTLFSLVLGRRMA